MHRSSASKDQSILRVTLVQTWKMNLSLLKFQTHLKTWKMTHERYSFQNLNIHCVSLPHTHPARDSRVNAKFQVHIGDASIPSDSHRVHCGVVFSFRKEGNTRPNFLDWKFRRKRLFLSWKQTLRCRFPISSEVEFISVSRNSQTQLLKVENHRGCIGVIGVLVFFPLPARLSRIYFTLSSQPGSTLRHRYVVFWLMLLLLPWKII